MGKVEAALEENEQRRRGNKEVKVRMELHLSGFHVRYGYGCRVS